jgi:hypothetical protein
VHGERGGEHLGDRRFALFHGSRLGSFGDEGRQASVLTGRHRGPGPCWMEQACCVPPPPPHEPYP